MCGARTPSLQPRVALPAERPRPQESLQHSEAEGRDGVSPRWETLPCPCNRVDLAWPGAETGGVKESKLCGRRVHRLPGSQGRAAHRTRSHRLAGGGAEQPLRPQREGLKEKSPPPQL